MEPKGNGWGQKAYAFPSIMVFRLDSGISDPLQEWKNILRTEKTKSLIVSQRQPLCQGSGEISPGPAVLENRLFREECKLQEAKIKYTDSSLSLLFSLSHILEFSGL